MTIFIRTSLILVLLLGLTVGLVYAQPAWVAELGLDFWIIPEMEKKLSQETERSDALDIQQHKLSEVIARKAQILHELVSEKITLYQAAAEIQQLTPVEHLEMAATEMKLIGKSPEEQLFRIVISWAQKIQNGSPQEATSLGNRLEKEMEQQLPH